MNILTKLACTAKQNRMAILISTDKPELFLYQSKISGYLHWCHFCMTPQTGPKRKVAGVPNRW